MGGYEEPRGRGLLRSSQGSGGNSFMMDRGGPMNNNSFSMGRSSSSGGGLFNMGRSGPFSNFSMGPPEPLLQGLSYSGRPQFESSFNSMGLSSSTGRFRSNRGRSSFASSRRDNKTGQSSGRSVLSRVSRIDTGKGGVGGGVKARTRIGKPTGAKNKAKAKKAPASTAAVPADVER